MIAWIPSYSIMVEEKNIFVYSNVFLLTRIIRTPGILTFVIDSNKH